MAALASDCLMYFRLLLWNWCMDFNNILQEASTYKMYNVPQPIGISFGSAWKLHDVPGILLTYSFSISPQPLHGFLYFVKKVGTILN